MFPRAVNAIIGIGSLLTCKKAETVNLKFDGSLNGCTFTRSGNAWNPDTGALVGTNSARFVGGRNGGSAILIESPSTNVFLNSSSSQIPVTQTITLTTANGGKWTCSITGPGSVTSSSGTATATGYGSSTAGVNHTVAVTVAGTVIFTVVGATSATRVQVENLPHSTSQIETGGVAVTRNAEFLTCSTINVFDRTYIEQIANQADRELSADTGYWIKVGAGSTINNGVMNITGVVGDGYYKTGVITPGRPNIIAYRVTRLAAGSLAVYVGGALIRTVTTPGSYTDRVLTPGNTTVAFYAGGAGTDLDIDVISVNLMSFQGTALAWLYIRPDVAASSLSTPAVFSVNVSNSYITLYRAAANKWEAYTAAAGGQVSHYSATTVLTAGWHLLGMTWDVNEMALWIDGNKQAGALATPFLPSQLNTNFYIGQDSQVPGVTQINMPIDNLRIYKRPLTATEMLLLFNSGW